jgi:glucosamine 6-phosphate synthetase-like amidotransferase/phosphosugar isomerase protein
MLVAQHAKALTLAITNTASSSLDQESENTLLIEATRVGWPTQSSSAALALLLRLATEIGRHRGLPQASELVRELDSLPDLMARVLDENDGPIARIAADEAGKNVYLFSSGGPNWSAAIIGAAKVKEATPDHAIEIEIEEYHHYNTQKPGEPLFLLAPSGPSVPRAVDTGRDARRYGGQLYAITTVDEHAFDELANGVLRLPRVTEALSPLLFIVPAQMIGYHLGMAKFAVAEKARRG